MFYRARDPLRLSQTCICLGLLWIGNCSTPTLYVRPYQCEKNTALLCVCVNLKRLFLNTHSNLNPSLAGYGLTWAPGRFEYYHNRLLIRLWGIKGYMAETKVCVLGKNPISVWIESTPSIMKFWRAFTSPMQCWHDHREKLEDGKGKSEMSRCFILNKKKNPQANFLNPTWPRTIEVGERPWNLSPSLLLPRVFLF